MKCPKVTVGVVLCGGEKYLEKALLSLVHQDYKNIEFLFRDQGKGFAASTYIQKYLPEIAQHPKVRIIQGENLWHSGGHNALIREMAGAYYVCASYDMWYAPDFVTRVVEALEKPGNKKYGTATVKICRWDFDRVERVGDVSKTNIIDSCGIGLLASHYFFDLGQTLVDAGQYDKKKEIFGGSGALVVFRKSALDKIAFQKKGGKKEFFDELIHYKNDIDLAYRLQWAGEKCLFLPGIKVWHDRQVSNQEGSMSVIFRVLKNRKTKSRWVKENSFWGHLVMMKKNFSFGDDFSFRTKWKTGLYLVKMFVFITLMEPYLWKVYGRYRKSLPEILAKKKALTKRVAPSRIESFFSDSL